MNWQDEPLGLIQYDDLLNALLAMWKTRYSLANNIHRSQLSEMYELGFEEALDAVAQLAGLTSWFEAGKAEYIGKVKRRQQGDAEVINPMHVLVNKT